MSLSPGIPSETLVIVDSIDPYGNRRQWVQRLVCAWDQRSDGVIEPISDPNDPLVEKSAEPKRRTRTPPIEEEVGTMRTASANGVGVTVLANQFGMQRGTIWMKLSA